jgi:hypothetical protein
MPWCDRHSVSCPFDGEACREYVCPRSQKMSVTATSRINCPILRQNGHCNQSDACKGCTKLK